MTLCGSCQLRSRLTCAGRRTAAPWLSEPDLNAWMGGSRLNLLRALSRVRNRGVRADRHRASSHAPRYGDRADQQLGSRRAPVLAGVGPRQDEPAAAHPPKDGVAPNGNVGPGAE
jgi:hypothetical protein